MKTIEIQVYTLTELKEVNPTAFARLHERFAVSLDSLPWIDEINQSLSAVISACGTKIKRWYNNECFQLETFPQADLQGRRAFAWLENVVKGPLRKSFNGGVALRYRAEKAHKTKRPYTLAGEVPACPFTGYYMDDVLLESLEKSIRDGEMVHEAISGLASIVAKEIESDMEQATSEEEFIMYNEAALFTIDGKELS